MGWEIGFAASVELVMPLSRALFPSFSSLRNRAENISDAYFRVISAALLVSMPASMGIALVAEPLVRIAFGVRWLPAVPVIQIFALVGILKVIATISGTLLTVYGLQAIQWRIVSVSLIVRLVLMVALVTRFGLLGGALAAATSSILDEIMYLFVTFRRFHVSATTLLYSNWRCLFGVTIMTITVLLTERWCRGADQLPVGSTGMVLEAFVGVVSYATVVLVAWLAAGRPPGAEYYALGVLRAAGRSLLARWKIRL
jgi:O-antigen/teichoic acid export membrane protein